MANVKVVWGLPTIRGSGKPQDPALLAGVEIAVSADGGASWTVTDLFKTDVLETLFTDLEVGVWKFRGVAVALDGQRGPESIGAVEIVPPADLSAPGPLAAFEVTLAP